MIRILGIPYDDHSSFMKGTALGPPAIRRAFECSSTNKSTESELDLGSCDALIDAGDMVLDDASDVLDQITRHVDGLLENGSRIISLGGDHSITFPILRAFASRYDALNVIQLDAHPDLYDELDGDRFSHACPFARSMEENLIGRLVQIGIRTMNPHQRQQAERFNVEVFTAGELFQGSALPAIVGPAYLTLDLDVLDPAFAPGVSHHEPGGLSTREVLHIIQSLNVDLVGADIVELNPTRDVNDVTAMVAAKLLKEIAAKML